MSNKHRKNKKGFFGRPVWRNSTKTLKVNPLRYYQPETLDDVLEMVQEGIKKKIPVRAVGSGHSFSLAPKADGILIDTDHLNELSVYQFAGKNGNYFEVGGGIKVKELNRQLDIKGYCIPVMGGIDHQSIAGAISTGTHGSSLHFGAMANMVKSILLVSHNTNDINRAQAYRIEPENGITDPSKYNEAPILIRDDEIFNSAIVSFGTFGIVFSYVLEVDEMFYFSEKKVVKAWNEVRVQLEQNVFSQHDSVFIQVNPYEYNGKQLALLATHDRKERSDKKLWLENLKHNYWHRLKRMTRSVQHGLASIVPYMLWLVILRINLFPNYIRRFLNTAVKSQRDEQYFNKGYKVMYQGLDYIKERAFDCEFAVPVKNGRYLEVLDELIVFLQQLSNEYQIHLTSPVGLRFVKGSGAYLTPEYSEDVCYIDTPVLLHVYGRDTIISRIQQFMIDNGAKAHWGKLNNVVSDEYVKICYPKLEIFKCHMKAFNPAHLFSNVFTRQMLDY